jgi:hypothetical protein
MKSARARFLAALALYGLWVVGLATLAVTSAARPVNLQEHSAEIQPQPTPAESDQTPDDAVKP